MKEKLKRILSKLNENKRIFIIVMVIILLIMSIFYYFLCFKNDKDVVNNLKVVYYNGDTLEVQKKDLPYEKKITINNPTNENITYSFEWKDVSNTFKDQNKLLYTIESTGDYAANLGKSQVPVTGYKVFPSVVIQAHKKQTYIVKLTYEGTDKKGEFKGKIYIDSEKVKKQSNEKLLKKQEEKNKKKVTKNSKITKKQ